jgi:hypothetical protein
MQPALRPGRRHRVSVESARELGASGGRQLGGEGGRRLGRGAAPHLERVLVGDAIPVGEGAVGAFVGEDEAGQVGRIVVEQAQRPSEPVEARGVREDVAEPVGHRGDAGLELVEDGPDGGPHHRAADAAG